MSVVAAIVVVLIALGWVARVLEWAMSLDWVTFSGRDSPSAAVRNVVLAVAGPIGLPLLVWRSELARRQVRASERDSLIRQHQSGVEMLGNDDLSVRLGGVHALYHLASNHVDQYGAPVFGALNRFCEVKSRQRDDAFNHAAAYDVVGGFYKGPPDGIEAAVCAKKLLEKLDARGISPPEHLVRRLWPS